MKRKTHFLCSFKLLSLIALFSLIVCGCETYNLSKSESSTQSNKSNNKTSGQNETPDSLLDSEKERIIHDFIEAIEAQECLGFDYWEKTTNGSTRVTTRTYYDYDRRIIVVRSTKKPHRGQGKSTVTYTCFLLDASFVPKYFATTDEKTEFEHDILFRDYSELTTDQKKYELLVPESCRYKEGAGIMTPPTPTPVITLSPTPTPPKTSDAFVLQYYNVTIGDTITFGKYKDDAIVWKVLQRDGNRVLLLSKYGLTSRIFNDDYEQPTTWQDCSLRKWLNNDFYNSCFTSEEKKRILITDVSADKNPEFSTSPGKSTKDKVFLLSINEVISLFPANERERMCIPTSNANINEGVSVVPNESDCMWWLRTPGEHQNEFALVFAGGSIVYHGYPTHFTGIAVRPAIWITLKP